MPRMSVSRNSHPTTHGCRVSPAEAGEKRGRHITQSGVLLLCLATFASAARGQAPAPIKPTPTVPVPVVPGLEPIYLQHSFQLCCQFEVPEGIISPKSPTSGTISYPAWIDSNLVPAATKGVQFRITPLPASELPTEPLTGPRPEGPGRRPEWLRPYT